MIFTLYKMLSLLAWNNTGWMFAEQTDLHKLKLCKVPVISILILLWQRNSGSRALLSVTEYTARCNSIQERITGVLTGVTWQQDNRQEILNVWHTAEITNSDKGNCIQSKYYFIYFYYYTYFDYLFLLLCLYRICDRILFYHQL